VIANIKQRGLKLLYNHIHVASSYAWGWAFIRVRGKIILRTPM